MTTDSTSDKTEAREIGMVCVTVRELPPGRMPLTSMDLFKATVADDETDSRREYQISVSLGGTRLWIRRVGSTKTFFLDIDEEAWREVMGMVDDEETHAEEQA